MELLLPAGSPEAFHAAVEGGADAIYLGLNRFSARGRAKNFNLAQFAAALDLAEKNRLKVFLTLNTLIKNSELEDLISLLDLLQGSSLFAVIVQDWGVYWLIKNFFPGLRLHASTQMGIHNSLGAIQARELGFERVVLARELTASEVQAASRASEIETEVFVHGALCYSFSGACFFSSWLGGMSANRGLCRQPCRRRYHLFDQGVEKSVFSLADLELVDRLSELKAAGVSSLKVEGRMKPAEYVYKLARAYRIALDHPERLAEAKKILSQDFARDKTGYFFSGSVKDAISRQDFAGLLAGEVVFYRDGILGVKGEVELNPGDRIRIQPRSGLDAPSYKIANLKSRDDGFKEIELKSGDESESGEAIRQIGSGNRVYLLGRNLQKFPTRFKERALPLRNSRALPRLKERIASALSPGSSQGLSQDELLVRLNSLTWLSKIEPDAVDGIILDLDLDELERLDFSRPMVKKNLAKLVIALPLFIQESKIDLIKGLLARLHRQGARTYLIHQIWQYPLVKDLAGIGVWFSETTYTLNDAAISLVKEFGAERYILPYENDYSNLAEYRHRDGVLALYYRPRLFYSRMPALKQYSEFADRTGRYSYRIRDGLGTVSPEIPVALFHRWDQFFDAGYRSFLIDLTDEKPNKNLFRRLIKSYHERIPLQQTSLYNYKAGLS